MKLTQEQLAEIEARAEAATPGEWYATANGYISNGHPTDYIAFVGGSGGQAVSDAEFIAHAREDIPALLAYIREIEKGETL